MKQNGNYIDSEMAVLKFAVVPLVGNHIVNGFIISLGIDDNFLSVVLLKYPSIPPPMKSDIFCAPVSM